MATQRLSSSTSQDTKKRKRDNSSFSEEEEENIITSSSSSSSTSRRKYDVFLSFYGEDTRWGFTDHLYNSLKQRGINVYRDDEILEQGKVIRQELLQAIQESQCAIIVLSANYAVSKWCLMELAKIIEWEEKKKLTIIPIFYHVDPSHVRNQIGPFAGAFAAHENDLNVDTAQIDIWKNAFRKVGNIAGEHIKPGRYESEIIRIIGKKIFEYTMQNILFYDHKKLVGINSRVEQMMKLLDMESNDVRFLGIHGMGGVGKTTLAKVIYGRVSCQFEGSGFISCVRKECHAHGLANLQQKLLSMIMGENILVHDHFLGITKTMKMLRSKKVFIVLDDVDDEEQLMALAGSQDWFGAGSRVIITCRDSHLLITHKVNHNDIYKVELLQTADALQLFSLSAFDKPHPPENYIDLCMDFVRYAQGLPLALTVLGSFLLRGTIDAWKSARYRLEEFPPDAKIMAILQISFEGLQDPQKDLFLDMACFERWLDYNIKENIYSDIEVLIDKSLVTKSYWGELFMHDLLRKMGQEIVHRECPGEPGRRSRLFRQQDVLRVLKNNTGTDVIECIVLDRLHNQTKESLNARALSKMRNLRWFIFCPYNSPNIECREHSPYIEWHGNPLKYLATSQLRILHLYGCHLKSWPPTFQPKNLTELIMRDGHFKRLWKGSMDLCNLKKIDLSYSKYLIKIPNLTGTPKLEKIVLEWCTSLCEVHPSVGALTQLQELIITGSRIKQVWKELVSLCNLKRIDLSGAKYLKETPDFKRAPDLEKINLTRCTSLCEVHPSIGALKGLQELIISGSHIKRVWKGLGDLCNLKKIDLSYSKYLIEIPDLTRTPKLEKIVLEWCTSLCEVHPSVGTLKQLQELIITGSRIKQVWKGLVDLCNLKKIDLSYSEYLIEIPDLTRTPNLEEINLAWCRSLCEVHPSVGALKQLQELIITGSCIKQVWKKSVDLCNLKILDLSDSKYLIEIPDLTGTPKLEKIVLDCCTSLCEVHPSVGALKQLQELIITGSSIKQVWKGSVSLCNLKRIDLCGSKYLNETPDFTGAPNLEEINFFSSTSILCEVHPSIGVLKRLKKLMIGGGDIKQLWKGLTVPDNLKELYLYDCVNLIEMPDFARTPNLENTFFRICKSLCEVHPSIRVFKQLQKLTITDNGIRQLWKGLVFFDNLKELVLENCENLIEMPDFTGTPNLERIFFFNCKSLCKVPPSIEELERLRELTITGSRIQQVWKGLVDLENLKELDFSSSKNLMEMPDLAGTPNLEKINFENCKSLCVVHPSIGVLKQLQELNLTGSRIQQVWKGLVVSNNLKELDFSSSENLIKMPNFARTLNLEKIDFEKFKSLCEVHPSIRVLKQLQELKITGNRIQQVWKGLVDLSSLYKLIITGS